LEKIEGDLATALQELVRYFERRKVSFALVGALVPALLLSPDKEKLLIGTRETRDADHVVLLKSWEEWDAVLNDLERLGFRRGNRGQEHRLYFRTAEIDLIPYGLQEGPDEVLVWPKSGHSMHLAGFSDVFRYAEKTEVAPGIRLPVIPLWLFVVLKAAAYSDRKLMRDVGDIVYVLDNYEPLGEDSRRFEVIDAELSVENAGAYLLGQDIRTNGSTRAQQVAKDFVQQIDNEYHQLVTQALQAESLVAVYNEGRRHAVFQLLQAFQKGIG
jgi:predicted nucleotidyltransferase